MQPFSKSSFIPKKSIQRVERVRGKKRVYIIAYVAYGLFFGTLLATLLVFLYVSYLEGQLESKISELNEQRKSYNHADLQVIQDWEYKLRLAESFYANHLSPYRVLRDLEQYTASDVRFSNFSYTVTSGANGSPMVQVSLAGETERFDSVAFQDTAFSPESIFRSAEIGGVTKTIAVQAPNTTSPAPSGSDVQEKKPVSFSVTAKLKSDDIAFDMAAYEDLGTAAALPVTTPFTLPATETELDAEDGLIEEVVETPAVEAVVEESEGLPASDEVEI